MISLSEVTGKDVAPLMSIIQGQGEVTLAREMVSKPSTKYQSLLSIEYLILTD